MSKILVTRFSALGDIAMTIPVLQEAARQNPQHEFVVASRAFVAPLFEGLATNVSFRGFDLRMARYKGWRGAFRLYADLRKEKFDLYADLHDVLRTKILCVLFRLIGVRVAHIRKQRHERRMLTRPAGKILKPQTTSFEKYTEVFNRLGIRFDNHFTTIFQDKKPDITPICDCLSRLEGQVLVGVAPFASYATKEYPQELMRQAVEKLAQADGVHVFLFGAGKREREIMDKWAGEIPHVEAVSSDLGLKGELLLMSRLAVMVSMDSANMHLASLVGTEVVSVWGATHPYLGFMGWGQSLGDAVQCAGMPCRPCSAFGKTPCCRKDLACLYGISPQRVADKVLAVALRKGSFSAAHRVVPQS